jgi:hypothetical protein
VGGDGQHFKTFNQDGYQKIILTTDQDLIKDGVQAIDDVFLEWFVNNPSCEYVEIAYLWKESNPSTFDMYQIIIPQEEPKNSYLPNSCDIIFETASLIDDEKESLEEAAEKYRNYWLETKELTLTDTFIAGAKWQAERMYSEEDMIEFAEFIAKYPDKNRNYTGQMLHAKSKYDGAERTIDLLQEWFKKFKKK